MKIRLFLCPLLIASSAIAQVPQAYELRSPGGDIRVHIEVGDKLTWAVTHNGHSVITASSLSMTLSDGTVLGDHARVTSAPTVDVNTSFDAINYRKATVNNHYRELTLHCRGNYGVTFRAYDDAVAYRFFTGMRGEITVAKEEANFNFANDHEAFIPIQWDYRGGANFNSSFEALYREIRLSQFPTDSLAFLPLLVEVGDNLKAVILEADLENYPGMYVDLNETGKGLEGVFAPYPLAWEHGGFDRMNLIPTRRADYIARVDGRRAFPWRAIAISEKDRQLLNNDIVQKLASPNRLSDVSWIKPGLVAWDWWNNWNITGVDFEAGVNTATYKYYIDFAAANRIPYIVMDDGWSDRHDLFALNPDVDLKAIVDYGKQKNVGVILWASWSAVLTQMDRAFPEYSALGVKGFKIDFIDRDDQLAVASTYAIAKKAAEHRLLVDYHGVFKPTGLQRTYPNVVGYEGVKGLENYKWAIEDQPRYAVTIPYIRMMAGPMDYTPGAMRNSNRENYRPINGHPMSMGTRVHQMAMYVVYEAPLQMLADNPSAYMQAQECTDFIVNVPVAFDETVALDGEVGEYVVLARRKGDEWFIAAMTNWTPRTLTVDLSFLPDGEYHAVIFRDGVNAHRQGTDYRREEREVTSGARLNVRLSGGGGWVARVTRGDR